MIFVSSWDDGHPLDERVGEILAKFGLAGTFYVPVQNSEGRPVLDSVSLRRLFSQFEVGGHTLDHTYLDGIGVAEMKRQVALGKLELEDRLGSKVRAFCYPGGRVTPTVKQLVIQAGFTSSRTVENLRMEAGDDPFMIPTTFQFFPQGRASILRNFVKRGHYRARIPALKAMFSKAGWLEQMLATVSCCAAKNDAVLHVWGHSWELDEHGLWESLELLLESVASLHPETMTVSDLAARILPGR